MAKFKVGDRVRIVECGDAEDWVKPYFGKEAKIVRKCRYYPCSWNLDITHGSFHEDHLRPIAPPDELAWQQFKTYLQPNPAILPPIVTTSDEEAARIAETTPGAVVNVVKRGVVVSTYWGSQW